MSAAISAPLASLSSSAVLSHGLSSSSPREIRVSIHFDNNEKELVARDFFVLIVGCNPGPPRVSSASPRVVGDVYISFTSTNSRAFDTAYIFAGSNRWILADKAKLRSHSIVHPVLSQRVLSISPDGTEVHWSKRETIERRERREKKTRELREKVERLEQAVEQQQAGGQGFVRSPPASPSRGIGPARRGRPEPLPLMALGPQPPVTDMHPTSPTSASPRYSHSEYHYMPTTPPQAAFTVTTPPPSRNRHLISPTTPPSRCTSFSNAHQLDAYLANSPTEDRSHLFYPLTPTSPPLPLRQPTSPRGNGGGGGNRASSRSPTSLFSMHPASPASSPKYTVPARRDSLTKNYPRHSSFADFGRSNFPQLETLQQNRKAQCGSTSFSSQSRGEIVSTVMPNSCAGLGVDDVFGGGPLTLSPPTQITTRSKPRSTVNTLPLKLVPKKESLFSQLDVEIASSEDLNGFQRQTALAAFYSSRPAPLDGFSSGPGDI